MHRLRRIILITGTLLCVLIAAGFVVSVWWWVFVAVPGGPLISVYAGAIEYEYPSDMSDTAGCLRHGLELRYALAGTKLLTGFTLPLVYPFLAVAVPTLLVWWFGRNRIKPGHCPCGYDLQGNESGVCPECGKAAS